MINVMRSPINVGFVSANGINPCEMGSETNSHDKHHVLIASEKMPKELSAVWVKQNGYWYPAVRCSDSDYPFTILKAMPISENNQYVLIYFIHTQSLCWANVLLVCSIDAKPEPLGFGSHESAYELVKRMSMSQHYMIEILASYILSITEKLHIEVVIETERDVKKWIELTNDAHSAKSYCSLGKILLKLHSMISDGYIKRLWREESFISWKQKCETVQNAKNIELLTQELLDSIVWEKVAKLFDSSIESEMDKEWKAWKEDNRMLFSASKRLFTFNILEDTYKNDVEMDSMVTERRKRQKLEIRRGEIRNLDGTESHEYHMPASSEKHNTSVLADKEYIAASQVTSLRNITENINSVENDSPPSQCHNNDGNSQSLVDSSTVEMKVYSLSEVKDNKKRSSNEHRYLQCAAFIEAKDKQCGRWASEGDIYCCVHSHFHSGEKALKKDLSKSVPETAICEGMTVHGRRCSHRCQSGSSFCKKHFTQDDKMVIVSSSEETLLERKAAGLSFDEGSIHSSINVQHQILGDVVERLVENGDNSNGLNMRPQQLYNQSQGTLMEKRSSNVRDSNHAGSLLRCLGWCRNNSGQCSHKSKPGSSFCEKHLPCSDNNAGKTSDRYITVELRNELIKNANSKEDKFYVGRAVDLLNEYMNVYFLEGTHYKSKSKARMLDWLIEEVSKDIKSAEALLKVVSDEKTKLAKELAVEGLLTLTNAVIHLSDPVGQHDDTCENKLLKCKLCRMGFSNSYFLGQHWISNHEKEAQSFLRGSCHLCKTQFRDKTDIENHVKSHHVDVLGSCPIISCMYCSNAVMDYDNLWKHVLEDHINDFIQSIDNLNELTYTDSSLIMEGGRCLQTEIVIQDYPTASTMSVMREQGKDLKNHNSAHKYTCRFCGLKFRLLPDLGRHHQAEHMNNSTDKSRCLKRKWKTNHQNSESLPKDMSFKGMGNGNANDNKLLNDSNCVMNFLEIGGSSGMPTSSENDKPNDNYCLAMAEMLIPDVQKTKPCPNNKELLSCARKACCKHKFNALLKETYGPLPDRLYRKAARLCSEANIIVEWHNENFICPKNCKQEYSQKSAMLTTLNNISNDSSSLLEKSDEFKTVSNNIYVEEWDKAENHVILTLCDMENRWHAKTIVICEDLSFGTEAVPIPCVIDEHSLDGFAFAILKEGKQLTLGMFMQNFCYITERRLDPSLGLDTKSSQLGCTCTESRCSAGSCDHVYLFDNDNDDAEDIFGHPMHGRFPYDGNGRIILEEGYLVYECNSLCTCNETCPNRVLQKGVQVKLEVYKTKRKGWAVRAAQKISRGTFICEYLGEVLNDQEANKRGERYDKEGCSYLYDIDAHIDTNELIDGMKPFVIDATKYGNVARFINHSCCPNLVNYQVLVESMDCQLAHIGLYASRDIAIGEELAYDYRYKLLPGDGCPCQCGARNCRGRLY